MAIGLKVTATGPAAKLFTGWWRSWGLRLPHHPVNNFGKPIRNDVVEEEPPIGE
jgi:hypothetical protein